MLTIDLTDFGLSGPEAKVYMSLLELGGGYVSTIAKKANFNRVACYHTLGKLLERGLINSVNKNGVKYFTIENPKTLVAKQQELLKKAEKLLPALLSLQSKSAYKPQIQYYEGRDGIKKIFEDMLETRDEILGYTNLANLPKTLTEDYLRDYAARKMKLRIKTRMLSPTSKSALAYLKKYYPKDFDHDLVEILFINPKQFMFEYEINIYDDKVAIISLNTDEIIGLIIQSAIYAKTERAIFSLAWLGATSFVAK